MNYASETTPYPRLQGLAVSYFGQVWYTDEKNGVFPDGKHRAAGWMGEFLSTCSPVFPAVEDRMRLVIDMARHNVERGTGGPFGAGVFDSEGRLIAPGVNLVVSSNCSILHAEIIALSLAQRILGRSTSGTAAGSGSTSSPRRNPAPCASALSHGRA